MNYLWGFMILISVAFSVVGGNVTETLNAGFAGATSAVEILLSFAGVMCFWTGLLKVAEICGITNMLKKFLFPLMHFLFPKLDKGSKALEYIILNITANILGLGNGATPIGIKAMKELDKGGDKPTDEMCMFTVLNTTAFTLIPTTVIALRASYGALNPSGVIIPIWITSFVSLAVSVISVKFMCGMRKKDE